MKIKFILCLALGFVLAGCETDRMPSQKGTWIGLAESKALYTYKGKPHQVLQFTIQDGPRMFDGGQDMGSSRASAAMIDSLKGKFFVAQPIIAETKFDWYDGHFKNYAVNPELYAGKQLKISGKIDLVADILDSTGTNLLIRSTPKLDVQRGGLGIIRAKRIVILNSTNSPNEN